MPTKTSGSELYKVGVHYLRKISGDIYEYTDLAIDSFDTAEEANEFAEKLKNFVSVFVEKEKEVVKCGLCEDSRDDSEETF